MQINNKINRYKEDQICSADWIIWNIHIQEICYDLRKHPL